MPVPCACKEDFETSKGCTATREDDRSLNTSRQEIIRGTVSSCARVGLGGVAMRGVRERDSGDYRQYGCLPRSLGCGWESRAASLPFL